MEYLADGVQDDFPTVFKFFTDADLRVYTISSGVPTLKTLTTHYTVTGAGDDAGGTVTFVSAPTNGLTVRLQRWISPIQESDYVDGSALPAETLEDDLDRRAMVEQQALNRTGGTAFDLGAAVGSLHRLETNITKWDAESSIISNVADGTASTDAVNLQQLNNAQLASGNVPTPTTPGQDNYMLVAAAGAFTITSPSATRTALGLGTLATQAIADLPDNSTITISGGGKLQVAATAPPRDYIDIQVASASSTSFTVQPGEAIDSTNAVMIRLGSAMTKISLADATGWQAGTGNRGRASGTSLSNGTTFHIFLIAKADGTTDVGLDTDGAATNLLNDATDYIYYRRICSGVTAAGPVFRQWTMLGDEVRFNAGTTLTVTTSSLTTTSQDFTISDCPTGVVTWPLLTYRVSAASTRHVAIFPTSVTLAPTSVTSNIHLARVTCTGTNPGAGSTSDVPTDTSATIRAQSSGASTTLTLTSWGFRDRRGKQ